MENQAYLKIDKVNKTFQGVKALIDVSMEAFKGEVLGIAGINGAGKSTLMNTISGFVIPETGEIIIDGKKANIKDTASAEKNGIAIIHQEAVYFEHMSVAENMFITRLDSYKKHGMINYDYLNEQAAYYLNMMGSDINPKTMMRDLKTGERQLIEIVRAIAQGAEILLFDEPTSSLTNKEKIWLFDIIGKLKAQNKLIIYITHFLEEMMKICDKVLVMRDGKIVKNNFVADIQMCDIVNQMFGEDVKQVQLEVRETRTEPLLKVANLNCGRQVKNVSFTLNKGEILGLWGLLGSGRTEIIRALLGLDKASGGMRQLLDEKTGKLVNITGKQLLGKCGYVTENRHYDGLFLAMPIYKNFSMASLDKFNNKLSLLKSKNEKQAMNEYIGRLHIAAPDPMVVAANLSGGNQQKVLVARWIYRNPEFFVFDEPTRGVDVKAKSEIHQNIVNLVEQGKSVILISSEEEEIIALSSRVLVVDNGSIVAELEREYINSSNLKKLCVSEEESANVQR